ncbi:MAG: hypothetical protein ACLUIQ_03460 [Dialister invisus]
MSSFLFLVVAYLGYVIGLFEVGVLFVQFVLSAQVSGPDAVFFFGQSYVSILLCRSLLFVLHRRMVDAMAVLAPFII